MTSLSDKERAFAYLDGEQPAAALRRTAQTHFVGVNEGYWLLRDAADLIERQVATTVASEWWPIESAPTDGSPILVFAPTPHISSQAGWRGIAFYGSFGWLMRDTRGILTTAEPTHWMPLPAPPKG